MSQDWPEQHRQRHSIAEQPSQSQRPSSPLVAVPILETQIGIKRTSLRARSPSNSLRAGGPTTPLVEDPYADPGMFFFIFVCTYVYRTSLKSKLVNI